ncbi:L-ascorbate metabolism protein UlaG (beta-lactamase superfamily) [Idiomarina fontislapidosi]|uniref:Zn-dependent hydrolase n=1 Tax=Idiomarina fontislapidosi TaxID=263723 RepID=A0A432Y8U6_9GAMM|nr:MBL fold metallo-hydrolase [Idiomarina fontislapidosi]PYE34654.1 L-ascorbate metabolism protein UlaG (beta-lactamase superfamily) [Idiomarina fontislapidosi]RUO57394.1 Zn-dependent hydrolase [Idiomarina fontislapidosi]
MIRTAFTFSFLILLVSGCSTNTIQVINTEQQTEHTDDQRFENRYPGQKQYPATCETDCYRKRADIQCTEDACRYTGPYLQSHYQQAFNVTWYGHALFKIKTPTEDVIITDPVFDEFDWPINWLHAWFNGEYRSHIPALSIEQVSQADAILYSHLHYDHFNKSDIEALGEQPHYRVPLRMGEKFPAVGARITEMGWFSSDTLADGRGTTEITALPAHHFSSRTYVPFIYEDNERVSWNGWLLESQGKTLLYAGDTGYSKHFRDIHERYGAIDVCLLPIASYYSANSPDWYRYVHMTPEDAITAANELECRVLIPWGYGNASWGMGDHSSHSALTRFLNMLEVMPLKGKLVVLDEHVSAR